MSACAVSSGKHVVTSGIVFQRAGSRDCESGGRSGYAAAAHLHVHDVKCRAQVEELAGDCLLPALALTPANPALAGEVWALLRLLPYTTRWRLYNRLKACSAICGS